MLQIKSEWLGDTEHECLIIGMYDRTIERKGLFHACDSSMGGELGNLLKSGDIRTGKKEVTVIHTLGRIKTKRIVFIGLGKENQLTEELLKESLGKAYRQARELGVSEIAIDFDSFEGKDINGGKVSCMMGEAFMLSLYAFEGYKQKQSKKKTEITRIHLYTKRDEQELQACMNRGFIYGKGVNFARNLVNMPPNLLTATTLADYAKALAKKHQFEYEILFKEEMQQLGMGALLAVNQGSTEPPAMIVLKYQGRKEWEDVIGLVGKGVTYDTGGYSLKPKTGMVGMKTDMGGAASVLGAMDIIGELRPENNVVAVIASTDNMISGDAFKPDDVITSLSGKTIEVLNTDAEGRLALADAVTYAKQHGADCIVDVATLTGGVVVALGNDMTGAFTNNDAFYSKVKLASEQSGEPIWQLPITEKDRLRVRGSRIADLNNSPGRDGHAIMGAAFVGEFAEEAPWVHLDIAGTSVTEKPNELQAHGATGVMVRTLASLAEQV